MPDISLRFHKDMLVLSSPIESAFRRLGIDVSRDMEMTMLLEPETLEDAYKLESMAGAQCLVAGTATLTPARLTHAGMEERAADLARIALSAVRALKPQHILVEMKPCGLPLDPSSKASLVENRDQYARCARLFAEEEFDAFFLNGFTTCDDLKCALMGVRKVSDAPVFASVDVRADGMLASGRMAIEDAVAVMQEFEASVVGFSTAAGQGQACALASRVVGVTALPVLVQLEVRQRSKFQQGPTDENPYYCADSMMAAADVLRQAGVQFLRAVGDATPAYTGALVASTVGADVLCVPAGNALADDALVAGGGSAEGALSPRVQEHGEAGSEGLESEEPGCDCMARSELAADAALAELVQRAKVRVDEALATELVGKEPLSAFEAADSEGQSRLAQSGSTQSDSAGLAELGESE